MIQTIGVGEIAKSLGISVRQVWRLDSSGRLPQGLRIGRKRRWIESEIDSWIIDGCPARTKWEASR